MAKKGKKYKKALDSIDRNALYSLTDAVKLLKAFPKKNFDETVEMSLNLGIDGRQADQALRGTVMLPHGTGRDVRVLVIAQGDLAQQAEEAGADYVGTEFVQKIQEGWLDFDLVIAAPDMMGQVR